MVKPLRLTLAGLGVLCSSLFCAQVQATDEYTVELYDLYCTACHAVSASGAPQAFTDEWQERLDDSSMDELVENAINGIGNMPAMGTCGECEAQDLEDIIRYMATVK